MKLNLTFVAEVHKIKSVEYLDRQTGRMAFSWRLILDYGDDTGEIRCTEEIAKVVKKRCSYRFIASYDPNSSNSTFRITGVDECLGFDYDEDLEYDRRADAAGEASAYEQQTLAGTESQRTAASTRQAAPAGAAAPDVPPSNNTVPEPTSSEDGTSSRQKKKINNQHL